MKILGGLVGDILAKAPGFDLWTVLALVVIAAACYLLVRLAFEGLSLGRRHALFLVIGLPLSAALAYLYAGPVLGRLAGQALPQSPYERRLHQLEERLEGTPEWKQFKSSLPWSRTAAREKGFELARNGTRRLDDQALLTRAQVLQQLLDQVDEPTCAAMARGTTGFFDISGPFSGLDAAAQDAWIDLSYQAILAELQQRPAPAPPGSAERAAAYNALLSRMPADHKGAFIAATATFKMADDANGCWVARTIYFFLPNLEEPHRRALARALVQG
jgi:hypothetical protein